MNNKKKIVIAITSILVVLALIIGIAYALEIFQSTSADNTIKSGKISMNYTESSNVINITNALPMTDTDGEMQSNYFDFSITSDAKTNADDNEGITIPYDLIIEPKAIDTDKDALSPEQIKIFLTKIENGVEETVIASTLLSNLELKETNYNLYSTENVHKNGSSAITTKYRLRAWIDYNVEAKDWGKSAKPKQYKFSINVNGTQKVVMPEPIPKPEPPKNAADFERIVGYDGLVAESHPETAQLTATTAYRYTGANPDNYVTFNNEVWRIIGVFDVDDGTGNIEQRIKLIRNESIGNISWSNTNGVLSINDWSKATGMTLLNSGDYWSRTGDYTSIGLTTEAKAMIDNAKWYLGGTNQYDTAGPIAFYSYERGLEVYTVDKVARSTSWIGKVGLMYVSDYGYATSGGTTANRDQCLEKALFDWDESNFGDCKNNDWLLSTDHAQWTLSVSSGTSSRVSVIYDYGPGSHNTVDKTNAIRPVVFLKTDIKIIDGSGSKTDPYQLSL